MNIYPAPIPRRCQAYPGHHKGWLQQLNYRQRSRLDLNGNLENSPKYNREIVDPTGKCAHPYLGQLFPIRPRSANVCQPRNNNYWHPPRKHRPPGNWHIGVNCNNQQMKFWINRNPFYLVNCISNLPRIWNTYRWSLQFCRSKIQED
jgi:hypothetical protein